MGNLITINFFSVYSFTSAWTTQEMDLSAQLIRKSLEKSPGKKNTPMMESTMWVIVLRPEIGLYKYSSNKLIDTRLEFFQLLYLDS